MGFFDNNTIQMSASRANIFSASRFKVTDQLRVVPSGTLRRPVIHLLHLIGKQTCLARGLTLMAAAELRINTTRVR
ncbi:hypothetical protein PQQ96_07395 [Paraburkholderia sediminicola]|uniref:hypothetical protein n=1 Tax=Paraburkholderia sediminicola TaxID=458836 RepID=UPI0038BA0CC7